MTLIGSAIECAYTDLVDITSLVSHPRNPNTHTEAQIQVLAKLLEHHGWRRPITVSLRSGCVVRGHGMLQAAILCGCKQVPIDRQNYASEEAELSDLVADNQSSELSQFDSQMLMAIIEDLEADGIDMAMAGFDEASLERFKIEYGVPDVDFPEYDETAADKVKTTCCPKCGHEFPV